MCVTTRHIHAKEIADLSRSWELTHTVDANRVKDTRDEIDQYASIRYTPRIARRWYDDMTISVGYVFRQPMGVVCAQ